LDAALSFEPTRILTYTLDWTRLLRYVHVMHTSRNTQKHDTEHSTSHIDFLEHRERERNIFTSRPHCACSRLRKRPFSHRARPFDRSFGVAGRKRQRRLTTHSQQTESPEKHRRAPRPRHPAIPEEKGPKKPSADPTCTPLHAPSSVRRTLMLAVIAMYSHSSLR
jgi:hypothetical protein